MSYSFLSRHVFVCMFFPTKHIVQLLSFRALRVGHDSIFVVLCIVLALHFNGSYQISWNFPIPDSRNSGNDHFGQIAIYWVFFPRSFVHWVWCFTQNFRIFILLEFPNSRFQEISKLLFLTFGNSRRIKIWKFWVKSLTQWTKLSGKNSQYVAICPKWSFPDFLESGIWKFQENDDSKILSEKSISVNKTKWKK